MTPRALAMAQRVAVKLSSNRLADRESILIVAHEIAEADPYIPWFQFVPKVRAAVKAKKEDPIETK